MGLNFTECFKRQICCIIRNPKREITYAWLVSLVLVFIVFIVACVAASKITQDTERDTAAAFSAVWTSLLLVAISIGGTIIMRKFQTALSIGAFMGVIFIMTQQMLIIFAIFAERSKDPTNSLAAEQAVQTMAVFSFFLFLIYAIFGSMLSVFRDDIIREEVPQNEPDAGYPREDNFNQI